MNRLIYFSIILFNVSACTPSLSSYTQKLYDRYEWREADLKKVQFYLSADIILRRKIGDGKAVIANGQIKIIDGIRYEVVKFRRGTPGVLLFIPKENRMAVSFEDGGTDASCLMFGPNPNFSNRYVLLASEWSKSSGQVTYQGKKWETGAQSAYAGLAINLKNIDQLNTEARVVKGRTVQ